MAPKGQRAADTGHKKAPLPKGAGTAGEPPVAFAVTEGFTAGTSNSHKSNVETQQPIAPSGRELSPQVTEGASGRCSCGLIMERYLLVVVDTQPCTAVTIPGTKRLPCQRELARRSRD